VPLIRNDKASDASTAVHRLGVNWPPSGHKADLCRDHQARAAFQHQVNIGPQGRTRPPGRGRKKVIENVGEIDHCSAPSLPLSLPRRAGHAGLLHPSHLAGP